jgi:preprotein translocase subunit YajC
VGIVLQNVAWLVAQADPGKGAGPSAWLQLWPIFAILILFYLLFIRPQRQEARRREAMIQALKPNDHVITHGGIYGVVTNVHREANAVTIRVDENNNTRLKVAMGAIARVVREEEVTGTVAKKD